MYSFCVICHVTMRERCTGRLNKNEPVYGATCMHGPLECAANVQELCAMKYAKGPSEWWSFIQCINAQERKDVGTGKTALKCAKEAGIDWSGSGMLACSSGIEGGRLLRKSVKVTQSMNITYVA